MKIFKFNESDIDDLLLHSRTVGWYHRKDWEFFIKNGIVLGHRQNDEIISSAFITNYEDKIGWLGAFIINPDHQGQGLGKELLSNCLESNFIDDDFTLGLVSTERGTALYERMGFKHNGSTYKFISQRKLDLRKESFRSDHTIQEFKASDLKEVLLLDQKEFGADRSSLLKARISEASIALKLVDVHGKVIGFTLGVLEGERLVVGPLYAPNADEAMALITNLINSWDGLIRLDVLGWQKEFIEKLSSVADLELDRVCPIMTLKGLPLLQSSRYFCIIAQALG